MNWTWFGEWWAKKHPLRQRMSENDLNELSVEYKQFLADTNRRYVNGVSAV